MITCALRQSSHGSYFRVKFLTQVQSKPEVWQGVLHAQKSLPTEVSKSIEAMFSSAGRKKGILNSLTASVRKVFDYDVSEKIITLSPENVIALSTTSREGADKNSYQEGAYNKSADNESSEQCRRPLRHPQKRVLPVPWFATKADRPAQMPRGASATRADRFPQIPLGADVERYKLSSGFHNCASDWGNPNDEIDWDALTNGDID